MGDHFKITFAGCRAMVCMLAVLALACGVSQGQNITLDGTVTGAPQGNHPTTQVNAYLKNTGDPLGNTTTNQQGQYNILLVGTTEHQETGKNTAYPNPYTNQVNITQTTNTNHETKINVYDCLNFQTGELNELGLHMLRMAYIANLGTTFR